MRKCASVIGVFTLLLLAGGCSTPPAPGYQSNAAAPEALYKGIKGHKCGVMIFADWATRTEYAQIQLDTARLLTGKLKLLYPPAQSEKNSQPVVTELLDPASVVRFQREHPEVAAQPITEVAPRLGVSRLVYVEFVDFAAHTPQSVLMLKGMAKVTLRVLEVENGKARIAFEEADIIALFPSEAPAGVMESEKYNVRTIYEGTLDRLTDMLVVRFDPELLK